jgi:hypothetical protein
MPVSSTASGRGNTLVRASKVTVCVCAGRSACRAAHRLVLAPAGGRARVRRERAPRPLRQRHRPRLACHLALRAVTLRLAEVLLAFYILPLSAFKRQLHV